MELIILIVIVVLVVKAIKKKKASKPVKEYSVGDPSQLPNTLAELRRMRDKAKPELAFQCSRKICELGIQLFHQGMMRNEPGSEYDANLLVGEMYRLIDDANTYAAVPHDAAFEFRCLQVGARMAKELQLETKGGVFDFLEYAWPHLADAYAEGLLCPRDPGEARKYYRMFITYEAKMQNMHTSPIEGLMEVPLEGEEGRQEILKYIALMYGIGALKIKKKEIVRNFQAQTLQQAAELLFQMDWACIGGTDIDAMLGEYYQQAMAGNAYAQYKLGSFLRTGRYVNKDEEHGLEFLEKAAEQGLYLAVSELSNHYYWLANPYAGDYGGATKAQIQHYKAQYSKWSSRCDTVSAMVEMAYANSFTDFIHNSANMPTRGPGRVFDTPQYEEPRYVQQEEKEEKESDVQYYFTFPNSVMGPGGERYYKMPMGGLTEAKYENDEGSIVTIHISDVGSDEHSAHNSEGSFYW